MACGCSKKPKIGNILGNSAARQAVYQVITSSGELLSEFSTPTEARKAASEAGARVRVTSREVVL